MLQKYFFQTNRNLDNYNKNNSFFHASQTIFMVLQGRDQK